MQRDRHGVGGQVIAHPSARRVRAAPPDPWRACLRHAGFGRGAALGSKVAIRGGVELRCQEQSARCFHGIVAPPNGPQSAQAGFQALAPVLGFGGGSEAGAGVGRSRLLPVARRVVPAPHLPRVLDSRCRQLGRREACLRVAPAPLAMAALQRRIRGDAPPRGGRTGGNNDDKAAPARGRGVPNPSVRPCGPPCEVRVPAPLP